MSDLTRSRQALVQQQREDISAIIQKGEASITDFLCELGKKFYETRIACDWKYDESVWSSVTVSRTWVNWLKVNNWQIHPPGASKPMELRADVVNGLESFPFAVSAIRSSGLPLPVPTSIGQIEPYKFSVEQQDIDGELTKVYSDDQSSFVQQWHEAVRSQDASRDPSKPPSVKHSRKVLREIGTIEQRQARVINVTPPSRPQKTLEQIQTEQGKAIVDARAKEKEEDERRQQERVRGYFRKMRDLDDAVNGLMTFLEGVIANEGSQGLQALRERDDVGAYCMDDDVYKLQEQVGKLQKCYRLMTEHHQPSSGNSLVIDVDSH